MAYTAQQYFEFAISSAIAGKKFFVIYRFRPKMAFGWWFGRDTGLLHECRLLMLSPKITVVGEKVFQDEILVF